MPRTPPKPLSTPAYIGVVFLLMLAGVVLGAGAKNNGDAWFGAGGLWIATALAVGLYAVLLGVFARRVGNTTAWIIGGVMFGMALKPFGSELGRRIAGPDGLGPSVGEMTAFFLGYLFWVLFIHWRLAGVPNPIPSAWGGPPAAGTGSADSRSHSSSPAEGGTPP